MPHRKRLIALLVLLALACAAWWWTAARRGPVRGAAPKNVPGVLPPEVLAQLAAVEARERQLDETVWAKDLLAQRCGQVFEQLWDALNLTTNKFAVLDSFAFGDLVLSELKPPQALPHGLELREPAGPGARWPPQQWRQFLADSALAGWQLVQTEFRHNQFDVDATGQPLRSVFYFSAHLHNAARTERAEWVGDLIVDWGPSPGPDAPPAVKRIDASRLRFKTCRGEPAFRLMLAESIPPPQGSFFIDPLILYDLDGDGVSEIILAAENLVFRRRSRDLLASEPLCRHWPGLVFTGLIADFDGDGAADFLYAKFEGIFLVKGSPQGAFDELPRLVWSAMPHLKYGQVMTCGDIDTDGDLDLWLGQYKVPYDRGQMPTPYYDANDGHPAYLLLNDGHGSFTDATVAAGVEKKRWRRTYSGSFVDLDEDGDLDLMVVSDFSGLDLYTNDGRGRFTDVTDQWLANRSAAGMSHAVADFDRDGRLDLLMIGMNSSTVDRLNHLRLARPDVADDPTRRGALMFGNRLYLAQAGGGLRQTALSDSIARTGWSWGCGAADYDNDGWLDLYIATGHETKQLTREYETEFWLHDAYVASSKDDLVRALYFGGKHARTRSQGWSFGGWEKNRLYFNQRGQSFLEAGHLLGVALEPDSRNVAADDLDGDGRVDLLVTTFEAWPEVKQAFYIFRNELPDTGNWIGFRLREQGAGISPVGARVTVRAGGVRFVRQIITGDSYRVQHANTVHFGLGDMARVDEAEVRWQNGRTLVLREPAVNRYHQVRLEVK